MIQPSDITGDVDRIESDLAAILGVDPGFFDTPPARPTRRRGVLLASLTIPLVTGLYLAATWHGRLDAARWRDRLPALHVPAEPNATPVLPPITGRSDFSDPERQDRPPGTKQQPKPRVEDASDYATLLSLTFGI